jgi:hypothetical protein
MADWDLNEHFQAEVQRMDEQSADQPIGQPA